YAVGEHRETDRQQRHDQEARSLDRDLFAREQVQRRRRQEHDRDGVGARRGHYGKSRVAIGILLLERARWRWIGIQSSGMNWAANRRVALWPWLRDSRQPVHSLSCAPRPISGRSASS